MFQKIVRDDDTILFHKRTNKYFDTTACNTNLDVIRFLYKSLQKQYRCEYVYKNNLLLNIIKKESLKTTVTLNELKIGSSKADLVLLNGCVRVYEIKTGHDDLSKLPKQINDYQKFAEKVYVVTDEKHVEKLKIEYVNTDICIIVLDANNKLQTIKEADNNTSLFDFDTIFKILRKKEYLDLFKNNFGFIPNVPNTQIFRFCYKLLANKNIVDFQKQVLNKLKERKISSPKLLKSSDTPKELKHICNSLDLNEQEYSKLYNFLKDSACINRI